MRVREGRAQLRPIRRILLTDPTILAGVTQDVPVGSTVRMTVTRSEPGEWTAKLIEHEPRRNGGAEPVGGDARVLAPHGAQLRNLTPRADSNRNLGPDAEGGAFELGPISCGAGAPRPRGRC